MNNKSIGICLVGNYDFLEVPPAKMNTLAQLINVLMYKAKISIYQVHPHWLYNLNKTCPGKKFYFSELRKEIKKTSNIIEELKNAA
jgi:N-acetyl-anhydromuramyl-L-alanine amidase AmpD